MYPVLVKIGSFQITSYGLALALSFLFGIYFSIYRAKKKNIEPNQIMDLSVIIIISAIVGSRLLYVLFHLDEFRGHWLDTINPFQSNGQIGIAGLTMLGGVVLSFVFGLIYLRMKKLNFLKFADTVIPAVAFGIFLTRIGCFLNGCCYGLPCEGHSHFCVIFPPEGVAGSMFPGVPLIPTQLYSSAYGLVIMAILLISERWQKFDGYLFYIFVVLYGIARFIIDMFRYYEDSMIIFTLGEKGISLNQGISLLFVLLGLVLFVKGLVAAGKKIAT
ncbi:prolipoprotein diacylglyceryl transferase [candidate division KSB1 bacterium]|nr:prolipoprotein diacylglyceryl transferase [candidate division KSB1 bacterium]